MITKAESGQMAVFVKLAGVKPEQVPLVHSAITTSKSHPVASAYWTHEHGFEFVCGPIQLVQLLRVRTDAQGLYTFHCKIPVAHRCVEIPTAGVSGQFSVDKEGLFFPNIGEIVNSLCCAANIPVSGTYVPVDKLPM